MNDDEALLGQLQPVMQRQAGDVTVGKTLPRAQVTDAVRERAEGAGREDDVEAFVTHGADGLRSAFDGRFIDRNR
jgi:hypothetical protein